MSEQQTKTEHHHTISVPYNTQPAGLEKWADGVFGDKGSLKMPEGGRTWIANNVWWLALVGGVLSLLSAWNAYQATRYVSQLGAFVDEFARQYGTTTLSDSFGFTYYAAVVAMAVQGVLMLMAFQKLKVHQKAGWNLLFYSSLISLVMGILYVFTPYYGVASMIGVAIGVSIGWWIIFQIRNKFTH
ncbi:hypothetical protein KA093_02110 [Candidatus Saccharibacteria bacterium]|nr:hypothetical protein [Candidatus Saccharibacteria bacterium]